jgi:hypothetical protein
MVGHTSSVRPGIGDDKARNDCLRVPAQATSEVARQPDLLIELGHHSIGFIDACLELGDEECRGGRIEGELIDAPPLPVLAVRDLRTALPAIAPYATPSLTELSVVRIQKPIQLSPAPSDEEEQRGIQYLEEAPQGVGRARTEVAAFNPRDDRSAAARVGAEGCLCPVAVVTEHAKCASDPIRRHGPRLHARHYRRLTEQL